MEQDFNKILKDNIRLIQYISTKMGQNDLDVIADLVQVGRIGLWEAYQRYDETKGPFNYYATIWIKKYMKEHLSNNARTIRIPNYQINKADESLVKTVSINTYVGSENSTLEELLSSSDSYTPFEDKDAVMSQKALVEGLLTKVKKERTRDMIKMRFGLAPYEDSHYLQDIADKYGISREATRVIIKTALSKLNK